jgi:cytidylate kinase
MVRKIRPVKSIIEEQMYRWRTEQKKAGPRKTQPALRPNVVTVSHHLGSNGAAIAAAVAEQLGVPLYDREIVRHIAETANVQVETVETLDQHVQTRLEEYITALLRESNFHPSDYLRYLTRTVGALWEHGPCVLVGHGCVHLVPRTNALAVRVVAPATVRIKCVAERERIDVEEARRLVQRTDSERHAYHRKNFNADCEDSKYYDLILDSSGFDVAGCAAVIAEAFRRKFATGR